MFLVVGALIENQTNKNDGGVWSSKFTEKCKSICVLQDPKTCHKNKHHSKEYLDFQNMTFYFSKCFSFSGREILSIIYAYLAEIRPYVLMVSAERCSIKLGL